MTGRRGDARLRALVPWVERVVLWLVEAGWAEGGFARALEVGSWAPWWGPHGLEWPCSVLVVDAHGRRCRVSPVWDSFRWRALLRACRRG